LNDGYLVAGTTNSRDGDVSGLHGVSGGTYEDFWVMKVDKAGTLKWQKCYGGGAMDAASAAIETADHGFVIIGMTNSVDGDVTGFHLNNASNNYWDVWVLRIDSVGNKLWQKCMGGTRDDTGSDILELPNGDLFAVGVTASNDGDLRGHWGPGSDLWAIRLNSSGQTMWQNDMGGTGEDQGVRVKLDPDGNLIIGGMTTSKDGEVTGLHGLSPDIWLLKLAPSGNILWEQCYGGMLNESLQDILVTNDGEILFCGSTTSGNSGDVPSNHNYPDKITTGTTEAWFVKTRQTNIIKGSAFFDRNGNGLKDANEDWIKHAIVKSEKTGSSWQTSIQNGTFLNKVDTGIITTSIMMSKPYYTVTPNSQQTAYSDYSHTDSLSFAVTAMPGKTDCGVFIFSTTRPRIGFYSSYTVQYNNADIDTLRNRKLSVIIDHRAGLVSANPAPTSISGDTLFWTIPKILPEDSGFIGFTVYNSPATLTIGDKLLYTASIDTTGDIDKSDNSSIIRVTAYTSFDPNDKQENHNGSTSLRELASNSNFIYTVRFQNTGNDTAFNIVVRDTLDAQFDPNSPEMIGSSHPYQLTVKNGRYCMWKFSSIMLPDSGQNEPLSHGYFTYSLKSLSSKAGDILKNSAAIYFDFNKPVITNTAVTLISAPLLPPHPQLQGLRPYYCVNLGEQKIKVSNFPANGSGVTAIAQLDISVVNISADSIITFNPNSLAVGAHILQVVYMNTDASDTLKLPFNITAAVSPDVNLSSNITTVTNLIDPVVITATNTSGGGTTPKYTFAKDKALSNILQAEGTSNTLTIQPNILTVGSNWIYVSMKTSDTCFTAQTNIDSIKIERSAITGLTDVDFPNQVINVYPNPFCNIININGLNAGKTYAIIIANAPGQKVYNRQVINSRTLSISNGQLQAGRYWLSIYDLKKHSLIGSIPLIKE